MGYQGFVPCVCVSHTSNWFVLGCLVVLPSLYDESVLSLKLYSVVFTPTPLIGESACLCIFVHVVAACPLHIMSRTSRVVFSC